MEQNKKKIDGLLSLLANEATADSRNLLKKYSKPDAKNTRDLELKLADLYKTAPDKIVMDKEFCEIHPHKNFIIKYTKKTEPAELDIIAPHGYSITEDKVKDILKSYINENNSFSNCDGNPNCGCNKSSFAGYNESFGSPQQSNNNTMTVALTVVGIVAILGIFMHHKH
jgi:hypothetical protein